MKLLLLACLALPVSLLAQGGLPNQPYIYVEGKGEITKAADMATLRFEVVARNPDQAKANQEVQAKANQILSLLNDRKIAHQDVVAGDLKSEPQYQNENENGQKRGRIIGYAVTRSFAVKVRDITIFPKLVDELLAIAGLEFSGIDAGLAHAKEMEEETRQKAMSNARERADNTLKEMRMKIDSVFAVSPVTFPDIQRAIFGYSAPTAESESAFRQATNSQYRLAPITFSQSVHVIYLISPLK